MTPTGLMLAVLVGLAGWAWYVSTHPEKRHMTVRKREHYRTKVQRDPFQLELDAKETGPDGEMRNVIVTFRDPNRIPFEDALAINDMPTRDQVRVLLGDDFDPWWEEWRDAPQEEVGKLLEDAQEHYGAPSPGKSRT